MDEGSYASFLAIVSTQTTSRFQKWFRVSIGRYDSPCAIFLGFMGIATLGCILALIFPSWQQQWQQQPSSWDVTSDVLGYTYFLSWTLSFYPQIITNYKHPERAARGLSIDFIVWNIIGFALYAIYTTSLRYSSVVRKEYADRFGGPNTTSTTVFNLMHSTAFNNTRRNNNNTSGTNSDDKDLAVPQVKTNDVAFAWHAFMLTLITFIQIIFNDKEVVVNRIENDDELLLSTDNGLIDNFEREGIRLEDSLGDDSFVFNEDDFGHQRHLQNSHFSSTSYLQESASERIKQLDLHKRWTKRISSMTKFLIGVLILICTCYVILIANDVGVSSWRGGGGEGEQPNLLDFLYFLSFVKVCITVVKYIPQVMLNYQRKSTSGWQIWNILLDCSGGTLSIMQLIGDSFAQDGSWTGVLGNPAKLGLGLISICFDFIFIFQHYVFYRNYSTATTKPPQQIPSPTSDHSSPLLDDINSMF